MLIRKSDSQSLSTKILCPGVSMKWTQGRKDEKTFVMIVRVGLLG